MVERGAWGPLLRRYRKGAGLTQAAVAIALHRSRPSIVQWELSRSRPDMASALAFCAVCHCTAEEEKAVLDALRESGALRFAPRGQMSASPPESPFRQRLDRVQRLSACVLEIEATAEDVEFVLSLMRAGTQQ